MVRIFFIKQVNEIKKYYCIKFIERNIELLKILIKDHKPRNSWFDFLYNYFVLLLIIIYFLLIKNENINKIKNFLIFSLIKKL